MSKKVTLKQAMDLLDQYYEITNGMWDTLEKIDDDELYEDISKLQDSTLDLLDEYHGVDKHVGCPNWPECDEIGCGD